MDETLAGDWSVYVWHTFTVNRCVTYWYEYKALSKHVGYTGYTSYTTVLLSACFKPSGRFEYVIQWSSFILWNISDALKQYNVE